MSRNKILWGISILLVIVAGAFVEYQVYATNLAHSTFARYYAFRGCVQLIDKTETYADCMLANGHAIRLVLINDKWYLEGDGPGVW
jgi:CDP-diacylglycerol pyrophosphatase